MLSCEAVKCIGRKEKQKCSSSFLRINCVYPSLLLLCIKVGERGVFCCFFFFGDCSRPPGSSEGVKGKERRNVCGDITQYFPSDGFRESDGGTSFLFRSTIELIAQTKVKR